jgi:hypothetical protein
VRTSLTLGGLAVLAAAGCQFPDYDLGELDNGAGAGQAGQGGSSPIGAAGGEGGGGAPPDPLCDAGQLCATTVPEHWTGPMAFWQGRVGQEAPPDCPDGYGEPTDLFRLLEVPAAECTCTCGAVAGEVCTESAAVSIYWDLGCRNECAKPSALACSPVSGCNGNQGTIRAAKPAPAGGACKASVMRNIPTPSWKYEARLCQLNAADEPLAACTDDSGACAPTPGLAYPSRLCIVSVVSEGEELPECPAQYPNGGDVLYATFSDERACSACTCAEPTGGACSGTLTLTDGDACSNGFEYVLGSGCKSFGFTEPPAHLSATYALEKSGTCGVAIDTQPTGVAAPSGSATVVCCQ